MIDRRRALTLAAALPLAATARAAQAPAQAQAPAFWRRRVGDIELTIVSDGVGGQPLEGLVINAPLSDVQRAMADAFLPTDRFVTSYNIPVLNIAGRVVVLDTGNGAAGLPNAGQFLANFRAAGFDPARVDTVVLTHMHPDHINGFRAADGSLTFPNAETLSPGPEWDFWMDAGNVARMNARMAAQAQNMHRVLDPSAPTIRRFAWGAEIAPGLTALPAPGHTPGHTVFRIASGADQFLWMVDVTNNTDLLLRHPDFVPVYDVDGAMARETRRRLADMAVADRLAVGFYHAPFPATGHVERTADGYRLVPVTWSPML